jgi:hypothetical protein
MIGSSVVRGLVKVKRATILQFKVRRRINSAKQSCHLGRCGGPSPCFGQLAFYRHPQGPLRGRALGSDFLLGQNVPELDPSRCQYACRHSLRGRNGWSFGRGIVARSATAE